MRLHVIRWTSFLLLAIHGCILCALVGYWNIIWSVPVGIAVHGQHFLESQGETREIQTQHVNVFSAYVYNAKELDDIHKHLGMFIRKETIDMFVKLDHVTDDPTSADAFVVLFSNQKTTSFKDFASLERLLATLPYWNGGRNHVIVNLASGHDDVDWSSHLSGAVMIAQPTFQHAKFRNKFDLVIPTSLNLNTKTSNTSLPHLTPVKRRFLFSFWGRLDNTIHLKDIQTSSFWDWMCSTEPGRHNSSMDIKCSCHGPSQTGPTSEWQLCSTSEARHRKLTNSTFTLIPTPTNRSFLSTSTFQTRLYEALRAGSVPVVLGDRVALPFDEIINWKYAAVFLSHIRSRSIGSHLMVYNDKDIFEMRRNGHILWSTYMSRHTLLLETVLLVMRMRSTHFMSMPAKETVTRYNGSMYVLSSKDRNQSLSSVGRIAYDQPALHLPLDPFHYYRSTPFQAPWAADLIIAGNGSTNVRKSCADKLGGNFPDEKVTVVMIMFNRIQTLPRHVGRLKNLALIDRILILWDTPRPLTDDYRSLNSNGKLRFIHVGKDSLNNRFLPFDLIQTEAVLIMDDDIMPSGDFILAGFKLWRQNRERAVGPVVRTVGRNGYGRTWMYGDTNIIDHSIILTQMMFLHKYYLFLYTNYMPAAIRNKVDELMNCEDIAMNFLVAHVTRKPAVKFGGPGTTTCAGPGCKGNSISGRKGHYTARTRCVQYFTEVYGYMPLVFSQSSVTLWKPSKAVVCPP